jgi:hypothetical protein
VYALLPIGSVIMIKHVISCTNIHVGVDVGSVRCEVLLSSYDRCGQRRFYAYYIQIHNANITKTMKVDI